MRAPVSVPVGIIGFGNVGQHLAHRLLGKVPEIRILSRGSRKNSEGAFGDLQTAAVIRGGGTRLCRVQDPAEFPADSLLVQTAKEGYNYKDYPLAEARTIGLKYDPPLVRRIAERLVESGFRGHYLNITNPANAMASYAQNYLALPPERVLAFGSALDGGRFVQQLLDLLGGRGVRVATSDVEGLAVGEHGLSGFYPESVIRIGGKALEEVGLTHEDILGAAEAARQDGFRIVGLQGGTWFGPVEGALRSMEFLLAESHPKTSEGVLYGGQYVAVPVSKRDGKVVYHLEDLTPEERAALDRSLAQVQSVHDLILRDFDSTKQRRDILVLDDEPGLALAKARMLSGELEDDAELWAGNRLFFGVGEAGEHFLVPQEGGYRLAPVEVTEDLYDPSAPRSVIVGGPDVVVFDFLIGGRTNGFDVARQIKSQYQNTRVVIYTAHAKWGDLVEMANSTMETRSGKRVKVVDAIVPKADAASDRMLLETVKTLLRDTQFRTA